MGLSYIHHPLNKNRKYLVIIGDNADKNLGERNEYYIKIYELNSMNEINNMVNLNNVNNANNTHNTNNISNINITSSLDISSTRNISDNTYTIANIKNNTNNSATNNTNNSPTTTTTTITNKNDVSTPLYFFPVLSEGQTAGRESPVTSFSVLFDLSQMAVGLSSGGLMESFL